MDELKEIQSVKTDEPKNKKKKKDKKSFIIIALLIILIGLIGFKSCKDGDLVPNQTEQVTAPTEFEEDATKTTETSLQDDSPRINIGLNNYTISESESDFYIGYPQNNNFNVTMKFYNVNDPETCVYETKLIAPGTNVKIEGADICSKGTNNFLVKVGVFDEKTNVLVNDVITLKMSVVMQ